MSSGRVYRPELLSAFLRYAGLKGGDIGEVVPVVVLDTIGGAPYPISRPFQLAASVVAVAAQYAYVGIYNNDLPGTFSSAVIDQIYVQTVAPDDWVVAVSNFTTGVGLGLGPGTVGWDVSNEKDRESPNGPRVGRVQLISGNSAGAFLSNAMYPLKASLRGLIDGPFTLGPQAGIFVRPNTLNVAADVMFRGRYYAAP